jgi:hypothetical protein
MILYANMVEPDSNQLPHQFQGFEGEKGVQFHTGIEKDFEEIVGRQCESLRKLELENGKGEEEILNDIALLRRPYDDYSFRKRIVLVTNNFYFWWPEGWNRERLKKWEKDAKSDSKEIKNLEKAKRMISDMDRIIHENGYDNIAKSVKEKKGISTKDENEPIVYAVGDVYLKMRQLGYDMDELSG